MESFFLSETCKYLYLVNHQKDFKSLQSFVKSKVVREKIILGQLFNSTLFIILFFEKLLTTMLMMQWYVFSFKISLNDAVGMKDIVFP